MEIGVRVVEAIEVARRVGSEIVGGMTSESSITSRIGCVGFSDAIREGLRRRRALVLVRFGACLEELRAFLVVRGKGSFSFPVGPRRRLQGGAIAFKRRKRLKARSTAQATGTSRLKFVERRKA